MPDEQFLRAHLSFLREPEPTDLDAEIEREEMRGDILRERDLDREFEKQWDEQNK